MKRLIKNLAFLHPLGVFAAAALAVVVVTVSLDAYDKLPGPPDPGGARIAAATLEPAPVPPSAAAAKPRASAETPRRMQINHAITLMRDREAVVSFYAGYTGDREISRLILESALRAEVPVNLAFALAWQESRFNMRAVSDPNPYGGTRDWGLFQLNDGARPGWRRDDLLDPARNVDSGVRYLRLCLAEMGSVEMGLAAYNAGIRGVRQWGVPESTRAYIRAIIDYERDLDRGFAARF